MINPGGFGPHSIRSGTLDGYRDDPMVGTAVRRALDAWHATSEDAFDDEVEDYGRYVWRKWLFIVICIAVAFVVGGFSLTVGPYDIGFIQSYQIVWDHLIGDISDTTLDFVVMEYRMPRILVGLIAGAGLAVGGAVMQSALRNPLADSYTTGVSSGAGFGAALAIVMGTTLAVGEYAIVVNAFVFSMLPTLVIIAVSRMRSASQTTMIMAGIAIMYIFNAMTTVIKLMADPEDLASLYRWQVGSLASAGWEEIPLMFVVVLVGCITLQLISKELNALSTGDESAKALGVDADRLRILCLVIVAVITASVVSFTGLIGFVGLVAPHMVRLVIGPNNRYLIPASAIFGAALLTVADLVGRTILSPTVIQVGVITAFLGGPLFLWLIIRRKGEALE